jgi:hypothetical protein
VGALCVAKRQQCDDDDDTTVRDASLRDEEAEWKRKQSK